MDPNIVLGIYALIITIILIIVWSILDEEQQGPIPIVVWGLFMLAGAILRTFA